MKSVTSDLLPVILGNIRSIRSLPVTSGQVPVPLDKPVIFKATSGLRPRMTSEVTEVNNLEVTEYLCI